MPLDPLLRERFLAEVEHGELPLPLLPEVISQALAAIERPNCDARTLAELLRRDAALTAHVMRIAGSPVYAGAVKLVSLQQVIARLGFAALRQIVLLVTVGARTFRAQGFEAEVRGAFRHALASALFAQEIARLRRSSVDLAFLGGLFHDIGRPLALQALVDLHRERKLEPDRTEVLALAEEAHARIAGTLLARWDIAPKVVEACAQHHQPHGVELALVVALGDSFAHALDGDPFSGAAVAAELNVYPDDVAALAAMTDRIRETVETLT
ncbi:MAG: HDOD domain-containing protein [Myxococcales bacterium]|nr:HDOD domain-containing protein [Myxococcales bacterium]